MSEKKDKKGFWAEFREFIARGNVMDMAIGVVIGTAFTKIVNSLVNDIITPALGFLIGRMDLTGYKWVLNEETAIAYGNFLQSVLNFLIIAFVIFLMIRIMNSVHRKLEARKKAAEAEEAKPEPEAEPEKDPQLVLLEEIRDLLKK